MLVLFLGSERLGNLLEQRLPLRPLAALRGEGLSGDKQVDGVSLVRSLGTLLERELEYSGVVSQPPVVGLITG
jgi:hypothetical protein